MARRGLLAGGAASAAYGALAGRPSTAAPLTRYPPETEEVTQLGAGNGCGEAQRASAHAPFRAEFLSWLREAADRFAQPVWPQPTSPFGIELRTVGLHPALRIELCDDMDINVHVTFDGIWWDILASMDVSAEQADGGGWRNTLFVPKAQQLRPSREACWRLDGFEWLLHWFNAHYMPATHLLLFGGDGWTGAKLVRSRMPPRRRRSDDEDDSNRRLLPLHGAAG